MKAYEDLIHLREDVVPNTDLRPWYWLREDTGAWQGPSEEFWPLRNACLKHCGNRRNVIVQAGGCQGMYPRLWSNDFRAVYTFEPDPLNFHVLTLNCQKDNISKFQAALGSSPGMVTVKRSSMVNVGMHQVEENVNGNVPRLRIDDLGLKTCDLIQLDTEATEADILLGAMNTIVLYRPVVSVETYQGAVETLLASLGYTTVSEPEVRVDRIFVPG